MIVFGNNIELRNQSLVINGKYICKYDMTFKNIVV